MNQEDHQIDGEDSLAYRSLSTQAILGLLLALISPVAFIAPLLWIVPIAAAVICCAAAVAIRKSPDSLTGQPFALFGLLLSVVVASATYSQRLAETNLHREHAGLVAERFFNALAEEDFVTACELTIEYNARRPQGAALEAFYREDEQAQERLDEFASDIPILAITEATEAPQLVAPGSPTYLKGGKVLISDIYEVRQAGSVQHVRVSFERTAPTRVLPAWRILNCKFTHRVN